MRDVDSVDRERLFSEVEGSSTIVQKLKVMGKKIMTGGNTFLNSKQLTSGMHCLSGWWRFI